MSKVDKYKRENIITDLLLKVFQLMGADRELAGYLNVNQRHYRFRIERLNDV